MVPTPSQPPASKRSARQPSGPEAATRGRRPFDAGAWACRVVWLLLPLTVGGALADALEGRSTPVRAVAAVLAWGAWVLGLLATYVAHPVGLTALRLAGPSALAVAVGSVLVGRPSAAVAALALAGGAGAAVVALHPATADRCVDGASYGPERRVALRVPLPLLVAPLPLAWAAVVFGLSVGPLLLAARQWIVGGAATVFGAALAALAVRSVHGLSQRFIVLVPAGFVLHDRAALLDPVLFSRHALSYIGVAEADTDATDLTLKATGLVVEVRLVQPLEVPLRTGRNDSTMTTVNAVLFSPLRPGRLLSLAAEHNLPVA